MTAFDLSLGVVGGILLLAAAITYGPRCRDVTTITIGGVMLMAGCPREAPTTLVYGRKVD